MTENIKQQMHFVAFLDLLGYKDFFRKNEHEVQTFLKTINEALGIAMNDTNEAYERTPEYYRPQIKMFSDNILIAIRSSNKNSEDVLPYLNLVRIVAHIQKIFITKYQLFLRGGIAKDMFYFGKEYVFGKALIKAYEMEQLAIYPKINLSDKYVEGIIKHIKEKKGQYKSLANILIDVVGKERDGTYFINYLPTHPWGENIDESFGINSIFADDITSLGRDDDNKKYETIKAHKYALSKKINEYGLYNELFSQKDIDNRRKVILKYMWSVDYHNQVCKVLHFTELMINCNVQIDSRTLQPVATIVEE